MKLIQMTYYVGIHEEVLEILREFDVSVLNRWPGVHGRISGKDPREESHVWPGANSVVEFCIDDDRVDAVLERIRDYNRQGGDRGIDANVLDVVKCVRAEETGEA
ncbi:MAG: hypothetical protein GF405_10270 [Candidatus Eisenbacteria bacterium]|nr:hypothetical protein [Candidatus Eisenbacteria bacterium]